MRDLISFSDTSRVWIYQSNTPFQKKDLEQVNDLVLRFVKDWTSHNHLLRATGGIIHDCFIVLVVDESKAGASGCSIDKSVRFIQFLEQEFNQNLFDRLTFAYLEDEQVRLIHKDDLAQSYSNGTINDETLFFDNLVKTKGDYLKKWLVPLKESWHSRML
jgi:hypothetical protein